MKKNNEKAIFKIGIAKKLLEFNNKISRIDYNYHDRNKAVFYFEATNKLYRDLKFIEEEYLN